MSFFKAYDMRGTYGKDFDLNLVYKIGRALPQVVKGERYLVGRDCRETSHDVRDYLVAGLLASGARVTDIGLCTTPMVYYFTAEGGFDGSVMVTASHNPPSDNGLKVSRRGALPVGYADGLNEVERLVMDAADAPVPVVNPDAMPVDFIADAEERYLAWMRQRLPDLSGLRFAIDCSNGMAGRLARALFPDAVFLNVPSDGRFPNHSPNPLLAESRRQLAETVRSQGLDCGVVFDGDADRAMFVDECGEFVQPDFLIPVVARACRGLDGFSGKVLHDVRTSRASIETLAEMGFEPTMVPVGHAFAKPKMRALDALCGGELAGHYYFGDFFGCDSGILAAMRILGEIAAERRKGVAFSRMMTPIAKKYANSGELNFRVEDKDAAIARILDGERGERELSRSEMDGVRVDFPDWWFNVRKSNTEPYLRLVLEARDSDLLASLRQRIESKITVTNV